MLLEQVTQSEVVGPDKIVVSWSDMANDIRENWKSVVSWCLNSEIRTKELCWSWWTFGQQYSAIAVHVSLAPEC